MRERFKGTGSINISNSEVKERIKSSGLSEDKKNVLDMWHTEEMDDSDRESIYEKYNISKDDIRAYEDKDTLGGEKIMADDDVIRQLREGNSLSSSNGVKEQLSSGGFGSLSGASATSSRSRINDSLAGIATGGVMSGLGSLAGSGMGKGGIGSALGNTATAQEQIQYHVKNMDILLADEKIDPKDVKIEIEKKIGQHDEMKLEFNIKTEEIDKYVNLVCTKDTPIEVALNRVSKETGEDDFKRIFNGVIENGEVIRTTGEYSSVSLTAYSRTILMDREKHFRIFQDETMTRKQVLETIMKEHTEQNKIEAYYDQRLDQPLGRIYMQFGMTDWEFLNYMLSTFEETGMGVTAHLNTILFGYISVTQYSSNIEYATFIKKREGKNLLYRVIGTDPFSPGELLSLVMPYEDEYEPRRVYKSKFWINGDLINCDFESIDEKEYIFPLLGNDTLKGMAVEGKVVEVGGVNGIATLTLDFTHGLARLVDRTSRAYEDESAGSWQIPYTSMYSQSNTGFFVTPEKNDVVAVYFPSENEILGYVQGAVNNPGNERASNRDNRNFSSSPSSNGQPMFDFTLTKEQFVVNVTDLVSLTAANSVSMTSTGGKASVSGNTTVDVTCQSSKVSLTTSDVNVQASANVKVKGGSLTDVGGGSSTEINGATLNLN